jgi:osmotically-inducible protein OsmY
MMEHLTPQDGGPKNHCVVDAAKQRIFHQAHLNMQRIWCEFTEGRLFLRGQVPSFYHKQLAQVAVAGMDGVDQVVNDIEVVW